MTMKYRYYIVPAIIIGILVIVIIGANLYNASFQNAQEPEVIIKNVIYKQVSISVYDQQKQLNSFWEPANTIYTLDIEGALVLHNPTEINDFGPSFCSFFPKFAYTTLWSFAVLHVYSCPVIFQKTYSPGVYSFSLQEEIIPNDININIIYPFTLPLEVSTAFSQKTNYISAPYELKFYNNQTLNFNNVELTNTTNSKGQISFNIKSTVDYYSTEQFNLSNSNCNSYLSMNMISPVPWNMTNEVCTQLNGSSYLSMISAGTTTYSLSYDLVFPNNQLWSTNKILPDLFSFEIYFKPHDLVSNMYNLILYS